MDKLIDFLERLESKNIYYRLNKVSESILIEIAVPGQRWEVEFLKDGEIQVEKFLSDGKIHGESVLDVLFEAYSD